MAFSCLLQVIEDIPESEKQNLVSLDKRNVLQEFLTLVYGNTKQEVTNETEDLITGKLFDLIIIGINLR